MADFQIFKKFEFDEKNKNKNFELFIEFVFDKKIEYKKEYLYLLKMIKPQKFLEPVEPNINDLFNNFEAFVTYNIKNQDKKILNYWNYKHISVFLWIISIFEIILNRSNENFEEEDWEKISFLLPNTSSYLLKYKWNCLRKEKNSENLWTLEDDKLLLDILRENSPELFIKENSNKKIKWSLIAIELNKRLNQNSSHRMGNHCRERWFNHLNPYLIKKEWSLEDDIKLIELSITHQRKWTLIAKELPNRNQHTIKNRYLSIISKESKISRRKLKLNYFNYYNEIELNILQSLKSKRKYEDDLDAEILSCPFKKLKIDDKNSISIQEIETGLINPLGLNFKKSSFSLPSVPVSPFGNSPSFIIPHFGSVDTCNYKNYCGFTDFTGGFNSFKSPDNYSFPGVLNGFSEMIGNQSGNKNLKTIGEEFEPIEEF